MDYSSISYKMEVSKLQNLDEFSHWEVASFLHILNSLKSMVKVKFASCMSFQLKKFKRIPKAFVLKTLRRLINRSLAPLLHNVMWT